MGQLKGMAVAALHLPKPHGIEGQLENHVNVESLGNYFAQQNARMNEALILR